MSLIARAAFILVLLYAIPAAATGMLTNVRQVSAGASHTCALLVDGTVACWGSNGWGELGDGTTTPRLRPTLVVDGATGAAMDRFTQIVTGGALTCGLRSGDVYCWGYTFPGTAHTTPTYISIGTPVKMIAAKQGFVCALLANVQRSMRCWGDNTNGQLGDGTRTSRGTPADVVITERDGSHSLLANITQITAGSNHACAVLTDSSVTCWGLNWTGELGDNTFTDSLSPVAVTVAVPGSPKLTDIDSVTADGLHSCARFASTLQVACWGNNSQGQLGAPAVTFYTDSPVGVAIGVNTIDAGSESTCAMTADAHAACWGDNSYGQLGIGSTTPSRSPSILTALPRINSLSVGLNHACAVLPDSSVRCWGRGDSGEIGNEATATINPSPVPVAALAGS